MKHQAAGIAVFLLFFSGWSVSRPIVQSVGPDLSKALQAYADGDYESALSVLEHLMLESPREDTYYLFGNALFNRKDWKKAAAVYADGAIRFPLSAKLHHAAGIAYAESFQFGEAIRHYRQAYLLDPLIVNQGGARFDPHLDAIYIPAMHDHRGARNCQGRLFISETEIHFVAYLTTGGDDDSIRIKYTDIESVEIDRKKGGGVFAFTAQYSAAMLLANLRGPRRLILPDEYSRLDLKFTFKNSLPGYRGSWKKESFKFFFLETELGDLFLNFLEQKEVRTHLR